MKPIRRHDFKPEEFPVKFQIFSGKDGSELWSCVVEKPDGLTAVMIPGFAGTEHVPVRVRITCANGEINEA